jgi:AcrR family transcriptional regulator
VARNLVRGAVRLLRRRGYGALTLETIAAEAGEPRSAIGYYFGDKRGLVSIVHAAVLHQMRREDERRFERHLVGAGVLDDTAAMLTELIADQRSYRVFYEMLPEILRDPGLHRHQQEFDLWLLRSLADHLERSRIAPVVRCSDPLATLMVAALDGLAVQQLLEPRGFDPAPSLRTLDTLVRRWVDEHEGEEPAQGC